MSQGWNMFPLAVEDPLEPHLNTCRNVSVERWDAIRTRFAAAAAGAPAALRAVWEAEEARPREVPTAKPKADPGAERGAEERAERSAAKAERKRCAPAPGVGGPVPRSAGVAIEPFGHGIRGH